METKNQITDTERTYIRLSILKMKQWYSQDIQVRLARRIEELESREDRDLYLEIAASMIHPSLSLAEANYQWVKGLFNPSLAQ